jgi:phospholipid N-methyltransferase
MSQLNIFEDKPAKPEEPEETPFVDKLMIFLEDMNKQAEEQNRKIQEMLDEMQKDWSEEEKLQINDPKEYQRQQKLKQENPEEIMAKELTTEAIETLKNSKVDGMTVRLPEGQLDRKVYLEVKGRLELIGGSWKGGKVGGFVFKEDPKELLEQIANGESRNIKKEFQFFGTPDELADELVTLADIKEGMTILEPSAGQGAIIHAIHRATGTNISVDYFELMPLNLSILGKKVENKIINADLQGHDFLSTQENPKGSKQYDRIVANPPFSKNQDIEHIYKMYSLLKPGGRLVSIASKHWQFATNKKETSFRQFVEEKGRVIEIESGRFKESGTSIATCIIIIDKI